MKHTRRNKRRASYRPTKTKKCGGGKVNNTNYDNCEDIPELDDYYSKMDKKMFENVKKALRKHIHAPIKSSKNENDINLLIAKEHLPDLPFPIRVWRTIRNFDKTVKEKDGIQFIETPHYTSTSYCLGNSSYFAFEEGKNTKNSAILEFILPKDGKFLVINKEIDKSQDEHEIVMYPNDYKIVIKNKLENKEINNLYNLYGNSKKAVPYYECELEKIES